MKYLNIILILISFNMSAQEWITDTNFENKINKKQAFGDDQTKPVVVEFYAKFKAGLDLELPSDLEEIQEAINEINNANKF
jgi:hypothetical protein